jgi:Aspartate/tyrosine/aromatic aminotransferase
LNSPNNPTGACFDRKLLEEISKVAIENDLMVISDEVYDAFTYEGEFCPIASIPGMKERTITIGSFSKGYAMTGWRIGHVIAPDFIVNCMKNINENICYSAPSVSQRAALHALRLRKKYSLK